jgi:hypothetical protein
VVLCLQTDASYVSETGGGETEQEGVADATPASTDACAAPASTAAADVDGCDAALPEQPATAGGDDGAIDAAVLNEASGVGSSPHAAAPAASQSAGMLAELPLYDDSLSVTAAAMPSGFDDVAATHASVPTTPRVEQLPPVDETVAGSGEVDAVLADVGVVGSGAVEVPTTPARPSSRPAAPPFRSPNTVAAVEKFEVRVHIVPLTHAQCCRCDDRVLSLFADGIC